MRLIFALLAIFAVRVGVFTHVNIKPTLKTSYSYMLNFGSSEYYGFDLSLGGGVRVKDQTTILLQINYLRCSRDVKTDNFDALKMLTTSLSISGRFLEKKHRFSPVLEFDVGINVLSNAKDLYVDNNYIIHDKPYYTYNYKFLNNSIFVKTKFLLNISLKSLDFFIGPSFNGYGFHVKRLAGQTLNGFHPEKIFYDLQKGIGFEAQVMYTFPMKKHAAKKAQE